MNSEINNVSKLAPAAVLRFKQATTAVKESGGSGQTQVASGEVVKSQSPTVKADEQKQAAKETSLELVRSAAAKGNSIMQATNRNLEFQVDDSTKKVVVKIVDSKSGDVVRQIPSEDMLAFIKRMQDLEGNQGAMLQDRA
ncbi:MAG: flagellar protein FlaG [Methylococcales bacterium]|nr:flagellar protein FlaG [Methylococcaceae bacterium]